MADNDIFAWMFQRSPILAALFDPLGRFRNVSDALAARLGYIEEELIGRDPGEFMTPESRSRLDDELLPKLRRLGHVRNQAIDFVTASGATVPVLASALTEYNQRGAMLRTAAVYLEIGDIERIERKYRRLYRETPAMLHTVDEQNNITAVSDHWLQKLGYAHRNDVLGRPISDFIAAEDRAQVSPSQVRKLLASGNEINVSRRMLRKDGTELDVVVSSIRESGEGDNKTRVLVASKDMTARNRTERALRDALDENARLREALERERDYLREEVKVAMNFGRIVGTSPALQAMLQQLEAVAETPASVLILGESGVGKELIAHALHTRGPRADRPFVKVNCASVPSELFESEFFGHVKGAFTGAVRDRVGRFQLANEGTIFLDEVGEIPVELQGKLLRVLQEQEFERVGEDVTRRVDVRVIAATNRNLEEEVAAGRFREDLYYRLSVFPIHAPPLRERGDDVVQLAQHFLDRTCRDFGREPLALSQRDIHAIRQYDWPGNVRELKNVIERAVILSKGDVLRLDLSAPQFAIAASERPVVDTVADTAAAAPGASTSFRTEAEMKALARTNLIAALEASDWRVSGKGGAAALLGIRPTTLSDRIRSMQIRRPSAKSDN
ncbi:MAG: sigma 54-interacting transcriptional regulator [Pseudomonadota bacterium]